MEAGKHAHVAACIAGPRFNSELGWLFVWCQHELLAHPNPYQEVDWWEYAKLYGHGAFAMGRHPKQDVFPLYSKYSMDQSRPWPGMKLFLKMNELKTEAARPPSEDNPSSITSKQYRKVLILISGVGLVQQCSSNSNNIKCVDSAWHHYYSGH